MRFLYPRLFVSDFCQKDYVRLWGNRYGYITAEDRAIFAVLRLIFIGGSTLVGFAFGWVLSPEGRHVRNAALLIVALLIGAFTLFGTGPLAQGLAMTLAFCGFGCGIGYWLGRGAKALMQPPTTFGSSRWATVEHLEDKTLLDQDGIILGSFFDGEKNRTITYTGDRHLLTSAPTRGGKGVSHIIPNLLSYAGSVLVIDPKAENLLVTAKARQDMGQEVLAIDPWNIGAAKAGLSPARINPLDWIKLAHATVWLPPRSGGARIKGAFTQDQSHAQVQRSEPSKLDRVKIPNT